jgi:hypothetical protein
MGLVMKHLTTYSAVVSAYSAVIPAKAGIHRATHAGLWNMGPRLRGDDSGASGTIERVRP